MPSIKPPPHHCPPPRHGRLRAIELNPTFISAIANRASLKVALQDHEGALQDLDAALALDPADAQSYNNRGMLKLNFLQDTAGALQVRRPGQGCSRNEGASEAAPGAVR